MNCCCDCDWDSLPDEAKQNLCILNKSQINVLFIIGAILISYYSLNIQKQQVIYGALCPDKLECCVPDPFPFKITSNIITIIALVFFFNLSKTTLCQNTDSTNCSPQYNYVASALVLMATMIRLYDLLYSKERSSQTSTTTLSEEEEVLE